MPRRGARSGAAGDGSGGLPRAERRAVPGRAPCRRRSCPAGRAAGNRIEPTFHARRAERASEIRRRLERGIRPQTRAGETRRHRHAGARAGRETVYALEEAFGLASLSVALLVRAGITPGRASPEASY